MATEWLRRREEKSDHAWTRGPGPRAANSMQGPRMRARCPPLRAGGPRFGALEAPPGRTLKRHREVAPPIRCVKVHAKGTFRPASKTAQQPERREGAHKRGTHRRNALSSGPLIRGRSAPLGPPTVHGNAARGTGQREPGHCGWYCNPPPFWLGEARRPDCPRSPQGQALGSYSLKALA